MDRHPIVSQWRVSSLSHSWSFSTSLGIPGWTLSRNPAAENKVSEAFKEQGRAHDGLWGWIGTRSHLRRYQNQKSWWIPQWKELPLKYGLGTSLWQIWGGTEVHRLIERIPLPARLERHSRVTSRVVQSRCRSEFIIAGIAALISYLRSSAENPQYQSGAWPKNRYLEVQVWKGIG